MQEPEVFVIEEAWNRDRASPIAGLYKTKVL